MKKKWGQGVLAAVACAGLCLAMSSCGQSNTVDYLYLLSAHNAPGQINAYRVDSQSGALTQIPDSPYSSGGNNPVAIVASPMIKGQQYLYVANHDDNTIVQFAIGTDAKLYPEHTYNTPGSDPIAVGTDTDGNFLYVLETYQPGYSAQVPGPGDLVVYPIKTDGSLDTPVAQPLGSGTASYFALDMSPAALTVLHNGNFPANNCDPNGDYTFTLAGTTSCGSTPAPATVGDYVYITETIPANIGNSCTTGQGGIRGFHVNNAGVLSEVPGSPYCAGVTPSSLAAHPLNTFIYATDSSLNQLIGYTIGNTGALTNFIGAPVQTGVAPASVTVEPRGQYLYVANRGSQNVEGYSIAPGTGIPAQLGTYATDPYPQCVVVEPALARFVYTADYEGSGSSGFSLNPSTGALTAAENQPYVGSGLQTCLAAVIHGNHPVVSPAGVSTATP